MELHCYCPKCNIGRKIKYQMGDFFTETVLKQNNFDNHLINLKEVKEEYAEYEIEINPAYEPLIFDLLKTDEDDQPILPTCEKCGSKMVRIDGGVYSAITALNSTGFETKWSCSGHSRVNIDNEYQIMLLATPFAKKYIHIFLEELRDLMKDYPNLGENIPQMSYLIHCTYDKNTDKDISEEAFEFLSKHYVKLGDDTNYPVNTYYDNEIIRHNCRIYNDLIERGCRKIKKLIMQETTKEPYVIDE